MGEEMNNPGGVELVNEVKDTGAALLALCGMIRNIAEDRTDNIDRREIEAVENFARRLSEVFLEGFDGLVAYDNRRADVPRSATQVGVGAISMTRTSRSSPMADIVERLRNEGRDAMAKHLSLGMHTLCSEAADEIERLRDELDKTFACMTEARNALSIRVTGKPWSNGPDA